MTDHDQDRAKAAIKELQQQLRDAHDAVQRLKRDIPSENFPTAYLAAGLTQASRLMVSPCCNKRE